MSLWGNIPESVYSTIQSYQNELNTDVQDHGLFLEKVSSNLKSDV